jgi:hypothetical protein
MIRRRNNTLQYYVDHFLHHPDLIVFVAGNKVASNILFSINKPVWMVCLALFAVGCPIINVLDLPTP